MPMPMNFRKSLARSRVVAIALAVAGGAALAEVDDLVGAGEGAHQVEAEAVASDRDFDTWASPPIQSAHTPAPCLP